MALACFHDPSGRFTARELNGYFRKDETCTLGRNSSTARSPPPGRRLPPVAGAAADAGRKSDGTRPPGATAALGQRHVLLYHHHEADVTEADCLEWLDGLPARAQAMMRALGFEEMRNSLPLRRYVLEKNDIGMSDLLKILLSPVDLQDYQAAGEAARSPLLAGQVPLDQQEVRRL